MWCGPEAISRGEFDDHEEAYNRIPVDMTHDQAGRHKIAMPRDMIFEFSAVGNSVKVCAIDPQTGLEVSIVGPVNAG